MITIRHETTTDHAAIRAVVAAAFGQDAEADLVDGLRADGDLVLSLVATDGDDIVGHIAFSRAWIDRVGQRFAAVALAPMSVHPGRQRQGIGGRLIAEAHRRLAASGERLSVVVGHPDYYPRFGYAHALAEAFTTPYQGEALMACAFGKAPREGTLRFPAAFERMDD